MQYHLKCDIVNNEHLAIDNQGVFPMEIKPIIYSIISALITATIIFAVQNFWTEQEEIVRLNLIEGKQDLQAEKTDLVATQVTELKEGQIELKAEFEEGQIELKAEFEEGQTKLKTEFEESHAELLKEISKLVDVVQGNNDRLDSTNSRVDQTNSRVDETNSRVDETNSRIDNINSNVAKVDTP